jgi:putative ABC transport system permease protein
MNKTPPPKWPIRFFRWFCNSDYVEDIEGDLLERFEKRSNDKKAAKWLLAMDVLRLFRPGIIKNFEGTTQLNNYGMLKTMFKIAWRNAIRQKQFTVLNILGLTIGIATSLIIGLYVFDELSYDQFHAKGDRIYRINQPNIWGAWDERSSNTGPNLAVALREDAPEFEQVTRLLSLGAQVVSADDEEKTIHPFEEMRFYSAEENFFDVFTYKFLSGDPRTALNEPMHLVLTQKTLQKYFGKEAQPALSIGKTLRVKDYDGTWKTYTISGVLANIPNKSHLQFDLLSSLKSQSEMMDMHEWKWIWTAFSTYGLVQEGTNVAALEEKMQAIPPKWAPPTTERIFNQTFEEFTDGNPWKLTLQPLEEIFIAGNPSSQVFGPTGNPLFVKIFGAIGLLVLILSAINFMNLSTARSSNRSKEVGIRKVMGSTKSTIINQFLLESILFVFLSTLFAFAIVSFGLDEFNQLADKSITLTPYLSEPLFYGIIITFIVLLGVLAGSYSAFYLSSFSPIKAMKGKVMSGIKGKAIRNSLVVFQFTISIALIICTFFVQKQLSFASTLDVGFAKENILQIHNIEQLGFETESLKNRLKTNPAFIAVGKSFGVPPNVWTGDRYRAAAPESPVVQLSNLRTEGDYLDVLGLEFVAGRNFDLSHSNDKYSVILNEEATQILGWSPEKEGGYTKVIGEQLALASGGEEAFEIIGVVKDFHFKSIKESIEPLVIIHQNNDKVWDYRGGLSFYSMRLDPQAISTSSEMIALLESLEEEMASIDSSIPFEYSFMDQDFESTFRSEQRMGIILNLFTLMAMIIACLGLYGLAAFSAEQRLKELGIRKVLGAKVSELVISFSAEFNRLIIVSILISCPIAWYLVSQWLQEFAYSTSMDIWVFVASAFGAMLIAVTTISFQSIKSARRNPVETLKDE